MPQKSWMLISATLLVVLGCKSDAVKVKPERPSFGLTRGCYTNVSVVEATTAQAPVTIMYSSGDCHPLGKATLKTLDRFTRTHRAYHEGAAAKNFCVRDRTLVLAADCATDTSGTIVGRLAQDDLQKKQSVQIKEGVTFALRHDGRELTNDDLKSMRPEAVELWVTTP